MNKKLWYVFIPRKNTAKKWQLEIKVFFFCNETPSLMNILILRRTPSFFRLQLLLSRLSAAFVSCRMMYYM